MAHLELLLARAPAGSSGACLSQLGREALSQLASRLGFECAQADWSPRGQGAVRHSSLPSPWIPCLSHSRGLVAAGLATVPVGIDLEHARTRHADKLSDLVDLLPERNVRHAILQSADPLKIFYSAWTLHEALFKLDSLSGRQPGSVLETRLSRLLTDEGSHAWQWHDSVWTLSICTYSEDIKINSQPNIPLSKTSPPWFHGD